MGEKGFNVLGEEIRPRPGRDVRLPVGANTEIVANKLVSTSKGHISYANHKVNIFQTYEVNGDVDFNTGNINFPGNVIIKGNVKNGFTVRAGGDVDISGNLAGTVIIGGNLNVKGSFKAGQRLKEIYMYAILKMVLPLVKKILLLVKQSCIVLLEQVKSCQLLVEKGFNCRRIYFC